MLHSVIRRRLICCVVLFAIQLAAPSTSQAITYTWNGPPGPSFWSTPTNWSPIGIPLAGDTAQIGSLAPIDRFVLYNYTGPAVTLNSLVVNGAPTLFSPSFLMSGNTLSATTATVGDSSVGSIGMGWFQQSGGTNNVGSGGLSLGVTGSDLGIYEMHGGTTSIAGDVTLGNASFTAEGYLSVATTSVLTSTGTIVVNSGNLSLEGGTINTAALNLNGIPGNFLWNTGTLNITNSTTFDSLAARTLSPATSMSITPARSQSMPVARSPAETSHASANMPRS